MVCQNKFKVKTHFVYAIIIRDLKRRRLVRSEARNTSVLDFSLFNYPTVLYLNEIERVRRGLHAVTEGRLTDCIPVGACAPLFQQYHCDSVPVPSIL